MKLTSPLALVVVSFIATVVFITLNGYAFGGSTQRLPGTSPSSDHVNVLPQVYHQHDSTLFSRDPQIQTGATFATVVWPLIGWICPPDGVPWTFFILHVIALSVVFFLLWGLAVECGGGPLAGLYAVILFIVVRISPAAEPTYDTAFYTRGAALPLGLAAILCCMRGRVFLAAAMLILAGAIHGITAFHVLCVCLLLDLMPGRVKHQRWLAGVVVATLLIAVVAWLTSGSVIPLSKASAESWVAMQRAVNGSHLFIDLIPQSAWREFAVCALFLLPALGARAGDCLRRLAAAALIGAGAFVTLGLAAQIFESRDLLPLSPLRGLKLTMVLSLVSVAVLVARQINLTSSTTPTRITRISAVASGAALLALVTRQHYVAIVAFIVMMALGDWAKWLRVSAIIAAFAIGAWFIAWDASNGWENSTPTSWLIAAACFAGILALTVLASRVGNTFGVALASLVALGSLSIPAHRDDVWVYAARDYPWTQPSDPWAEAQLWVANNTPVDSLFLVPPWLEGFRTYARRSEFVEYKMGTLSLFHPAFGQGWAERMAALTPRQLSGDGYEDMAMNYNALTSAEIAAIIERYGITHVIVLAGRDDLPYQSVYQNALVRILKTM